MWKFSSIFKTVNKLIGWLFLYSLLLSHFALAENTEEVTYKFKHIKNSEFNYFALKSYDALKKYSKIYYFPMTSKSLVLKKSGDSDVDRSWKSATPEDWLKITSSFDDMAKKYFPADTLFGISDKAGPDVLALQVRLVEYSPKVNRLGEMGAATVVEQEVRSYGEILVIVMLVDSINGDQIGIISHKFSLGSGNIRARSASRASQMLGWRMAYEILLQKLKKQLIESHSAK